MFLTERELKEKFWKYYNNKGRALRYEFEAQIRPGNADLVTVEKYQGIYETNAFEFKLADVKKAILQARANAEYVNKSWIVVPEEKVNLVQERYLKYLKEYKLGAISVSEGGRWTVILRASFQKDIKMNSAIIELIMNGY